MAEHCKEFIVSFVRHDDLVPRLSYHNFETVREEFFNVFTRIKVPKIELYYHLKVPYSERFAAARNAQVLRQEGSTPPDTSFNETLEKFRAERRDKNKQKSMSALFLPGKIIHLVDSHSTAGAGGSKENYIAYYARREEFNQLEMSKRMYADHDIHSLVRILKDIKLGGANTMSLAFHDAPVIFTDDDDEMSETDVRLFACCANPYGKLPMLLCLLALVADALLASVGADCDFVRSSFSEVFNGTVDVSFGLFQYDLLDCDNSTIGKTCSHVEDYEEGIICVPYPPGFEPSPYLKAGRAFHIIGGAFGGLTFFMLCISVCFIIKQRTWKIMTATSLLVTLCLGFVFIIRYDLSWCDDPGVTCSAGSGVARVAIACSIWFLVAVGSAYLGKVGKKHMVMTCQELESSTPNPPEEVQCEKGSSSEE